jgi:Kef-type K+ transport system membrane component KefB
MEILFIILILLITARLFSELAIQFNIPALIGEVLAGVILGLIFPHLSHQFHVLGEFQHSEAFRTVIDLGIFFLMLYAGLELKPKELGKSGKSAFWIALGGMILPLLLGIGLGYAVYPESELKFGQVFFTGVALSITAVPVAIKVLLDLGTLNSKVGKSIVSAAVIDDVISLFLLAMLTAFLKTGSLPSWQGLLILAGKVLCFFAVTFGIGNYLLSQLTQIASKNTQVEEVEFSVLLIVALAFSVLAELCSLHFILGAFVAGLFFQKRKMKDSIFQSVAHKVKAINTGFLAPIFFASIGLSINLSALNNIPLFVFGLLAIATLGKVIGAGLPAKFLGMNNREALIVGSGMNARGAVELIIAQIALSAGLFETPADSEIIQNLFSAMVIMAILTTLLTPLVLQLLMTKEKLDSRVT